MDDIAAVLGIYAATLVAGVLSGLVPIVNSELYLIGAVLVTGDTPTALVLAGILAVGQMAAKAVLYQIARGSVKTGTGRFARGLEKAKSKIERWRTKPLMVAFVSSVTGLPPFYLVSLVAGLLEIRFVTFLWIGLTGRLIRFVTIALIVVHA
jgi:membrane protein YqaA with SNARE-associated domain